MTRVFIVVGLLACLASPAWAQDPNTPPPATVAVAAAAKAKSTEIPAIVEVEVVLAEWTAEGEKLGLEGDAAEVAKRVAALEKEGKLSIVERLRLTTVDQMESHVQVGENRPHVTGVSQGGFGGRGNPAGSGGPGMVSSVSYRSVGTLLRVTPSVRSGDNVVLDVALERSGFATAANAPVLAEPPMGDKIRAESTTTMQLKSALRLANGQTAVLAGHAANDQRQIALVTVKIVK